MDIRPCWAVCSCGYWLRAHISHFNDQEATSQGGVKCEKSAADRTLKSVQVLHPFAKGKKRILDGRFGSGIPH